MGLFSIIFVSAASFIHAVRATTCYYPNGNAATNSTPPLFACDPSAPFSQCCSGSDMCTTNGLCKSHGNLQDSYYWRSSCTDKSFKSESCFPRCYDSSLGSNAASQNSIVVACSSTTYCCTANGQFDSSCCQDSSKVFDAGAAAYLAGSNYATAVFPTNAATGTTSSAPTSSPTTLQSTTGASTAIVSPTPSSSSMTLPATTVDQNTGLSTGAKAGIGVGAVLGAAALVGAGVLAVLLFQRRSRSKRAPIAEKGSVEEQPERQTSELPPYTVDQRKPPQRPAEADPSAQVGQVPVEADSRGARAELVGSEPAHKRPV